MSFLWHYVTRVTRACHPFKYFRVFPGMSESSSPPSVKKQRCVEANEAEKDVETLEKPKKLKKPKPTPKPPKTEIISQEEISDAEWYIENGLRQVRPYFYTFQVYVKQRWFGRSIIDVMTTEFRTDLFYNHRTSIESGRLTVNGKKVDPDHIVKNGDCIHHKVHRHECPVLSDPIEIVANTDDLVVINKPCSIPAHPCGRYRHNSATFMLAKDHGMTNLRILYRLDRLTSGLMMFSKSHETAEKMAGLMVERAFKKTYLCRVAGRVEWETAECNEPIDVYSRVHGVYQVSSETTAKSCSTKFERVFADDKSSVVKCYPLTGRTHQIRVHLQYLGYPILNDPIYHNLAWGPTSGKGGDYSGRSKEEVLDALSNTFSMKRWVHEDQEEMSLPFVPGTVPAETSPFDTTSPFYDKNCGYCQFQFRDPTRSELTLFLHALKYEGPGFAYETTTPAWAKEDFVPDDDDDVTVREAKLQACASK